MRSSGSSAATAGAPRAMNSASRDGGSEMSWLEIEPISRFASGIDSRTPQKTCALGVALGDQRVRGRAAPPAPRASAASSRAPIAGAGGVGGLDQDAPVGRHRRRQRDLRQRLGEEGEALRR